MSAQGGPTKRPHIGLLREEVAVPERGGLVIVSHMGSEHLNEEMETDALTTCFLHYRMGVRSYVCVAGCGEEPIFIASKTDAYGVPHVKSMIPSTNCLRNITGDVMILLCHGTPFSLAKERIAFSTAAGLHLVLASSWYGWKRPSR